MSKVRSLGRLLDSLGPWLAIACVAIGFVTVHNQGQRIRHLIDQRHTDALGREAENKAHQRNAAINRAVNVETWCEGRTPEAASLNGIVRFNAQFVRRVTNGQLSYALKPNDCEQIIVKTLESGTSKPKVTPTNYPLVYRALHPRH